MASVTAPRIALLTEDHVRDAIVLLTRAFMPDPIFSHYFPDPKQRAEVFGAFFDDLLRSHIRFGQVYGAMIDGELVAAAVWRPPDAGDPTPRDRKRAAAAEKRVRKIDPTAANSLLGGFAALEAQHPKEPHWYLCFAGVEPRLQGRGIGSATLAPALEVADRNRSLCYLETPFPRTHALYRRLGYEIIREGNPFPGAPRVWAMLRAPASAPPAP